MIIEEVDYCEDIKFYFNQESVKNKWSNIIQKLAPNAEPIWIYGGGEFYKDIENNLLFVKPYDWNPILCCYSWILLYKNQMIIFGSMTTDTNDVELRIKYLPESLKTEKNKIECYIEEFVNWFTSINFPKFIFTA